MKNIDKLLLEMQKTDPETQSELYAFMWEQVIEQYEGIIVEAIKNRRDIEDLYQDCCEKIPDYVKRWKPNLGAFSTFLTWQLRGLVQARTEKNGVIPDYTRTLRYYQEKVKNKKFIAPGINIETYDPNTDTRITLPTVEADLDFEKYIELIKEVHMANLWIEHHLNDKTYKELSISSGLSSSKVQKLIANAHKEIRLRLENVVKV